MELTELKAEMNQRFEQTRQYIEQRLTAEGEQTRQYIEQRLTAEGQQTRQLLERVTADAEQARQLLERVTADAEQTRRHVEQRITAEGERTRRHFDVVAEQMKAERNLSLDSSKATDERLTKVSASNAADHVAFDRRLEDHEQRLSKLENQ